MFAQIVAICIFLAMFMLIILDKFERHYVTLGSGALVLVLVFGICMRSMSAIWETLNFGAFFESSFWYGASEESTAGINWSTVVFIAGMMIMVEGLGKAGFFRWLCLTLAKLVRYRTVPLLICFMALSAFLAMFIDSITVVLFLATVTLELAQTMKFLIAVALLITHAQTELTVACIGVIVAALTLVVLGLTSGKKSVIEIMRGVDYQTLLFFIGLFVSVAGLEKTGVLNVIANFIMSVSQGNIAVIVIIILWVSAITSAFVDNIPFAATMIPVIRAIAAAEGMDIGVLAWALSLGTDLGGNATPIGASANVVGTSASAKGGYPIGWGRYCKYCVPATIIVMAASTVYLFLRYL